MKIQSILPTVSAGFAMFSMFFGAGNFLFPLELGYITQDNTIWATVGLLISAIILPFTGVFTMILFKGDYLAFFGRIGKIPAYLFMLLIMMILGPFIVIPRCIALSYSTVSFSYNTSLIIFSAIATVIIFILSYKKTHIVKILGLVLTPLLLILLLTLFIVGFLAPDLATQSDLSVGQSFVMGLKEGYYTLDLVAGFFFSSIILKTLEKQQNNSTSSYTLCIKAICLGGCILAFIYIGLCFTASSISNSLTFTHSEEILPAVAQYFMGANSSIFISFATALACLTTAISLTAIFTDFLKSTLFNNKISYHLSLLLTCLVAFLMSLLKFSGIMNLLMPLIHIAYPVFIVITICNLLYKLWGFSYIKAPLYLTIFLSIIFHLS